jgi:flavin reductase (DIM6/NTAB) family NADH-FMN oxidoreductase RutF
MRKSSFILMMAMICLPVMSFAQDDHKYLAGAVPEENGKIVFKKEFELKGTDRNVVYEQVHNWLKKRMAANENNSRILYTKEEEGQIAAQGEEYLVFSNSALSLDRTLMSYVVIARCEPGKCEIRVEHIRYNYEDRRFTAEEQISDREALNGKKTVMLRGNKKFRTFTVDFADNLFESAGAIFNAGDVATPVPAPANAATTATAATTAAAATAAVPSQGAASLQGYKQLAPDKLPGNIIRMLTEDWMLITAGTDAGFNMMTASWGGLGVLYGKPVAICFINPARYTYQLMEKNDTYTLTFYTEAYREALKYCGSNSGRDRDKVKESGLTPVTTPSGSKAFAEAWLIIECRKLVGQSLSHDALFDGNVQSEWAGKQLHKMYIGEIINVWVK